MLSSTVFGRRVRVPAEPVSLRPVRRVMFPADPDRERERRVRHYARQAAILDRGRRVARQRQGPFAHPVFCRELNSWFPSTRAAAEYIRQANPDRQTRRADIRNAIVRGQRVAGLTFSYSNPSGPGVAPAAGELRPSGHEVAIVCLTDGSRFRSSAAAARYAGVARSTFMAVLARHGGWVRGRQYRRAADLAPAAASAA